MSTMTCKIKINWGMELIGDTRDTQDFYARIRPVVHFTRSKLNEEEIAKIIKENIQERLNKKG